METVQIEIKNWTASSDGNFVRYKIQSAGTPGRQWPWRLERMGHRLKKETKDVLDLLDFKSETSVKKSMVIIMPGFFSRDELTSANILDFAKSMKFKTPTVEDACLSRELLSQDDMIQMGLNHIFVMHDPLSIANIGNIFSLRNIKDEKVSFGLSYVKNKEIYQQTHGFAFVEQ